MSHAFRDHPSPPPDGPAPISYEVEAACRRLVVAFAHHLDHREFDRVAALFTEDGVWDRHGERLVGPSRILALLDQRPASQLERHVMTTIHVTQQSPHECAATSYAMIFRAEATPGHPATVAGPVAVGEFHDRFRLTDSGWRLSFKTSEPVFVIRPT
ncbi:nuclear transport factor 2 family protein [Streptomyces plumbiresistens]|uniref:SnoaL-like domain-containing protein n=1 Tax=Streptomyces plumbiresistens TaxID=511811 RepID=A0ABP7TEC3_9ACTN